MHTHSNYSICIDDWRLSILRTTQINLFITLPLYYTHGLMLKHLPLWSRLVTKHIFKLMMYSSDSKYAYCTKKSAETFWLTSEMTDERMNERMNRMNKRTDVFGKQRKEEKIKRSVHEPHRFYLDKYLTIILHFILLNFVSHGSKYAL